jgi:uncharacterized membrane protein
VSDRLNDLQRQRALAQEQLAWLEREIAREIGATPPPAPPAAPPPRPAALAALPPVEAPVMSPAKPAAVPAAAPSSPVAETDAEALLARFKDEAAGTPADAKRGCLVYFSVGMGLLVLGVLAWYFVTVHRR